jgi:hypothetical protein
MGETHRIKVRIVRPTDFRKQNRDELKRSPSWNVFPIECKDCKEGKRGHAGEGRISYRGAGNSNNFDERVFFGISDIARSMRESIRLRKTLRV